MTTTTSGNEAATTSQKQIRKVLVGASAGTALEWFDFALYGSVSAIVFPKLFFPSLDPVAGILASFAAFGIGLAARPLGAAFFSNLGDKIGRQRTMVAAIIGMGIASLAIGLLPGYSTWGLFSTILLVFFRVVQGFALGGESSAAQIMALEYAPSGKRGLYGGLVNMGSPLGQVFVALTLISLQGLVGEQAFIDWAWRIPFFIGFIMAILGYIIRRTIDETPVFKQAREDNQVVKTPLFTVFRQYPKHILRLTFLWAANVACSYVVTTYSLDYIKRVLGMTSDVGFTLVLITNIVGVFAIPFGGYMSDRFGRKPILYTGAIMCVIGALAYFPLLNTKVFGLMLFGSILLLGFQYFAFGVLAALFAEPFPTHVRYSGHAASYTLTNLVGGAPTPFVAALLLQTTGSTWSIVGLLLAAYLVTLLMIRATPETFKMDFHANENE